MNYCLYCSTRISNWVSECFDCAVKPTAHARAESEREHGTAANQEWFDRRRTAREKCKLYRPVIVRLS